MSFESDPLPRLTSAEDSELRQLTWFSKAGQLSEESLARLAYLTARDRRGSVRDVRPDPVSRDGDSVGAKLDPQPERTVTCRNCGLQIVLGTSPVSTCRNCGVSVPQQYDEPALI